MRIEFSSIFRFWEINAIIETGNYRIENPGATRDVIVRFDNPLPEKVKIKAHSGVLDLAALLDSYGGKIIPNTLPQPE